MNELNKLRKNALIATCISGGCLVLGLFLFLFIPQIGMFIFLFNIFFLAVVTNKLKKQFVHSYKEKVCKKVIEEQFDVEIYNPEYGFSKEFVKNTSFISNGNQYSSDDYISGNYQGIHFERSDVCMQDRRKNGKTTTTVTLFHGSWTVFTFPKQVSTYILIREKEFLSNGKPGGIFSNAPHTEKVKFEDIDFNKHFEVYAQDEHDAFYVCTPHFIEKIKTLESRYEGRLTIGIMENKVHILLDNGENAMEPSLFREVSEADFTEIENEMNHIIEIIDLLNLNRKEVV